MEVGLGANLKLKTMLIPVKVLILVLMEVGLGERSFLRFQVDLESLNPCFNGSRSRS